MQTKSKLQSSHRAPRLPHNSDIVAVAVAEEAVAAPAATPKAMDATPHQPVAQEQLQPLLQRMCR